MKYDSTRRQCLFNTPMWFWYRVKQAEQYPMLSNTVTIHMGDGKQYSIFVSVPSEIYMVMGQLKIKEVYGFKIINKMLIMQTDRGDIKMWVYKSMPDWAKTP